uniref:Uncharacterized protein n=1 Tax=Ditylenchus dipsaci TaxID=166011 RepID=A0A915D8C0_9BILA
MNTIYMAGICLFLSTLIAIPILLVMRHIYTRRLQKNLQNHLSTRQLCAVSITTPTVPFNKEGERSQSATAELKVQEYLDSLQTLETPVYPSYYSFPPPYCTVSKK